MRARTLALLLLALTPALVAQTQGAGRPAQRVNPMGDNAPDGNHQSGASVAARGTDVAIAWGEQNGVSGGLKDIYVTLSQDEGRSFGSMIRVDTGDPLNSADSKAPKIAYTSSGVLVAVWEENRDARANGGGALNNDVYFNVSPDGGRTWWPMARPLSPNPGNVVTDVRWIDMAVVGETVHFTWTDQVLCNQCYRQLWYARYHVPSDTLTTPTILNTQVQRPNPPTPRDAFNSVGTPKVVASGQRVVIAFTDDRLGTGSSLPADVYALVSPDGGNTWVEMPIESTTTGDVMDVQAAIDGSLVAVAYRDTEVNGGGGIRCVVSRDGGLTWDPEVNCAPALDPISGTGSRYPHVAVHGTDVYVVWTDDRLQPSGGASQARKAYLAYSNDSGGTWAVDVPLDGLSFLANQFTRVEANDDVVMVHMERDTFGQNRIAYAWSMDRGASWNTVQIGTGPDTDSPPEHDADFFVLNDRNNVGTSAFYDRPLGHNEVYSSGLRVPFAVLNGANNIEGNASLSFGQMANLRVRAVPSIWAFSSVAYFAVSMAGPRPATPIGGGLLLHLVPDALTFDLLSPSFLPVTSGAVTASGDADGMSFPWPFTSGAPELTVVGVVFGPSGNLLYLTDPLRVVTL